MNISDVKVRKLFANDGKNKLLAVVSIVIDSDFAVHDLKVVKGIERIFVGMPNRQSKDGKYQDIAHPMNKETRQLIEKVVIEAYVQDQIVSFEEVADKLDTPRTTFYRAKQKAIEELSILMWNTPSGALGAWAEIAYILGTQN